MTKIIHAWGGSHTPALFFPEISTLLFWIVVIAGLVFLFIYLRNNSNTMVVKQKEPSTEEILKERFARGEIEREEFKEKLKILRTLNGK